MSAHHPHVSLLLQLEGFMLNSMLGIFMKICQEIPNMAKIRQKYLALYVNAEVHFVVAGDIKLN